ncbi:glycosyltransferase family 2 protein [Loktanella sp. S4079]|uniref:glycosyltransferase family 2 protein n=1 Tax=Loktanella sp. S4079 TaxID=579483 RepID=UPI0005FA07CC|nr:hypothetical protein [Loktanella sp. S4079]KJZ20645.1 hypothetical protein TW80_07695 [Loktanella sp. S4079]
MHYSDLQSMISEGKPVLSKGPIAIILIEDGIEVESTIAHHVGLGFQHVLVFCAADFGLPDNLPKNVHRVDFDVTADGALQAINNAVIKCAANQWVYYCYNAEYLVFPFCETRSIGELVAFMAEERRDCIQTYTVDLYARDLEETPSAVDREDAYFDSTGYFALAREDALGQTLERQLNIYGGLRWRFEEHIAIPRQRLDRSSLYRVIPGLKMLPDGGFSEYEHNTISCPWHNNITAATASFRTAKALRRNPGSRHDIASFHWENSEKFQWHSQQLMDWGIIEPGQWF